MADTAIRRDSARRSAGLVLPERVFACLLFAPAMLFIGVIVAWLLVEKIRLSLTDADLGGESHVGLAN